MVFPILGANSASGEYEISNSLRFNDDDSPYLSKTPGSAGNRRTFTISVWAKRSDKNTSAVLYGAGTASTDMFQLLMQNDGGNNIIIVQDRVSGTNNLNLNTTAQFTDTAAWYHIVLAVDTTQSTSSNRAKLYVNGNQITAFGTETYPSEDYDCHVNNTVAHHIGAQSRGSANDHFDGYITELHSIDGSAKAQTDFGEFNANGVWIPKKYTGSHGTNGFFMQFKQTGTGTNSSGMGADTSGQDNHFAVNNLAAVDVTEDTCTNNFATMDPSNGDRQQGGAATFAEGNLQITTSYVDSDYQRYPQVYSTQAVSSGKWYFEMKITTSDVDSFIGVHSPDNHASDSTNNPYGGYAATGAIYTSRGAVRINDGQTTGHGTFSQNDIVGCALDIDNNKVYFHKNGTYVQSGDPAGNSGGQAIPTGYTYGFTVGNDTASNSGTMQANFGNPPYTISSGNNDGKYGNFEYAVPSGYYAVCTKRLAEFG
jgi:hypothetical protein